MIKVSRWLGISEAIFVRLGLMSRTPNMPCFHVPNDISGLKCSEMDKDINEMEKYYLVIDNEFNPPCCSHVLCWLKVVRPLT